jgi:hypothetical protein
MKQQFFRHASLRMKAIALGLISIVSIVFGRAQESTDDLWDISQGAVVTGASGVYGGFDARDVFGGAFGWVEYGHCVFADGQPPSFVHYVEWQTPNPVMVGGLALFALGDGPAINNQREFEQFVLKAKSSPSAPDYDLTVFTYTAVHPYDFVSPTNKMLIFTNFTPVTASFFRAEFIQHNAATGYEGPRIYELDGYPLQPIFTVQPTNKTVTAQANITINTKALGMPPLFYQWSFNGTNIDGATNASLAINQVQVAQAGIYSVVVSNGFGFTNSLDATLTVSPPAPCTAAPTNLISWWRAEDAAVDQVSGNNGTLAGNATYGSGLAGQGFVFDGSGDFVSLGNPLTLQSQTFTIEAWIKRASLSIVSSSGSGSALIFGYGQGGYGFGILNDGRLFLTKVGISNVILTNGVTDTDWHHVVVTKSGNEVIFYLDGLPYPTSPYDPGFTFGTGAAIGARADNQDGSFMGMIDELAFYRRALTPSEIQTVLNSGSSGKCLDPVTPTIVSHPGNTNILVGSNMAFNVAAGGSLPLSYQWRFNGTNIAGGTNVSLSVSNVQFASGGLYSVLVSNQAGSVVSSSAALTVVFPPAPIRIGSTNAMAGSQVVVPVTIIANGNENAIGFSLNFNTQRFTYAGVTLGSGATGGTLLLNSSVSNTGRLGVVVVFPYQSNFTPGTQEVIRVTFNSLPLLGVSPTSSTISFADQPVSRELTDGSLQVLAATYSSGNITLAASIFESDVFPRTNGNQNVSTTDWLQVGRFVARLDSYVTTNEFQRADCAPLLTRGDGQVKVTDWVQAGRYLAGSDPLAVVGGPIYETAPTFAASSTSRLLSVLNSSVSPGGTAVATIRLNALGDENALGFTFAFDSTAFTFAGVELGSDASGAILTPNLSQTGSGKLGIALTLASGNTFSAGIREVVKVNLVAIAPAGQFPTTLADQIVTRCVSDAQANELPVNYVSGTILIGSINQLPTLAIARTSGVAIVSWPLWAGDYTLQMADTLGGISGGWTNIYSPLQTNGGEICLTLPVTNQTKFFRLRR